MKGVGINCQSADDYLFLILVLVGDLVVLVFEIIDLLMEVIDLIRNRIILLLKRENG